MDTFDHMDEQERSFSRLEERGKKLSRDAAMVRTTDPHAQLAGLIVERGAAKYPRVRTAIEQSTGRETTDEVTSCLVKRATALGILADNAGEQAVEWFEQNAPTASRRLGIVVGTKHGFRMSVVEIPPAPGA